MPSRGWIAPISSREIGKDTGVDVTCDGSKAVVVRPKLLELEPLVLPEMLPDEEELEPDELELDDELEEEELDE